MNVRKLKNFAKFVAGIPRKNFNMELYCNQEEATDLKGMHTCGTEGCLAGWAVAKEGYSLQQGGSNVLKVSGRGKNKKVKNLRTNAHNFARKVFDLTPEQADNLFLPWSDKTEWWSKFRHTPKGAAKRIMKLVETGE